MTTISTDKVVELISMKHPYLGESTESTRMVFEKTIVYNLEKRYPEYCRMIVKQAMKRESLGEQVDYASKHIESQLRADVMRMNDPLLKNLLLNTFNMTNFEKVGLAILELPETRKST